MEDVEKKNNLNIVHNNVNEKKDIKLEQLQLELKEIVSCIENNLNEEKDVKT